MYRFHDLNRSSRAIGIFLLLTHAAAAYSSKLNVRFLPQVPPPVPNVGQKPVWKQPGATVINCQTSTCNCGQTSVIMVVNFYNGTTPVPENIVGADDWLAEQYKDPLNNYYGSETTLDKLAGLAKHYGFNDAVAHSGWSKSDLQDELSAGHPIIVAVWTNMRAGTPNRKHFMVLTGMDDSYVYLNDPGKTAGANNRYTIERFTEVWGVEHAGAVAIHPNVLSPVWPMSGHDPQRTGLSSFTGPLVVPRGPQLTFDPGSPIIGDLTMSAEGNLYFATGTSVYAIRPDGTQYAAPQATVAVTGPAIDDRSGYVYVGQQSISGWNVVRYTKQLQNPLVVYSGTGSLGPLIVGANGAVYLFTGGTAVASGPVNWSTAVCGGLGGGPTIGYNGDVYGMCSDGLHRVDGGTGGSPLVSSYPGGVEPMVDSQGNLHSGYEGIAFSAVTYVTWGDTSTWDKDLKHIASNSGDYMTSRASLAPDGVSVVRLGSQDYLGQNYLSLRGPTTSWDVFAGIFRAFTSVPTIDAAGKIFVGMSDAMRCVNLSDHSTVWEFPMAERVVTQPVIGNTGTVYVATSSGKVYSF